MKNEIYFDDSGWKINPEAIPVPLILFNDAGIIQYANPSFLSMSGFAAESLIGSALTGFFFAPLKTGPAILESFIQQRDSPIVYCRLNSTASEAFQKSKESYPYVNSHSLKCSVAIHKSGKIYCAVFTQRPLRLPNPLIDSLIGPLVFLDSEDRIVECNNGFNRKFEHLFNRMDFFYEPFGQFLCDGEWAEISREMQACRQVLENYAQHCRNPWEKELKISGPNNWLFSAEGQWQWNSGVLTGADKESLAVAHLSVPIPASLDIRLEFQVRCPEGTGFYVSICDRKGLHGGYRYMAETETGQTRFTIAKDHEKCVANSEPGMNWNEWLDVCMEKNGGRLVMRVNGVRVVEHYDLQPLLEPQYDSVYLGCGQYSEFRNFRCHTRPSTLDKSLMVKGTWDVRLKYREDEIWAMQLTDRFTWEAPLKMVQFVNVTLQRRIETELQVSQKTEAQLKFENKDLKQRTAVPPVQLLGLSTETQRLRALIHSLADTDTPILLIGETGTGKDLTALSIHAASRRREKPFVKIDCASLPPSLLESELFGYEKGAFTGASERKAGRFEVAGEGTIFLDEIGNLDFSLQSKLLRVLQDRAFERLGGLKTLPVKARIISATNALLPKLVLEGAFRKDLYYRMNGVTVELPPLRSHVEDIPFLFSHFLSEAFRRQGRPVPQLSPELVKKLCAYPWPGNVRELKHTVEYMALLGSGESFGLSDLPPNMQGAEMEPERTSLNPRTPEPVEPKPPRDLTKREVAGALTKTRGNRVKAASQLSISRRSLYHLLEKYHLE